MYTNRTAPAAPSVKTAAPPTSGTPTPRQPSTPLQAATFKAVQAIKLAAGKPERMAQILDQWMDQHLRRTLLKDAAAAPLVQNLLAAIPVKDRVATAQAYAKLNNGTTLSASLGELIRNSNTRAPLMALIPPPVPQATLTLDTFLEQIAVGLVYSNQTAAQMNADTHEDRRGSNPAALLKHFGYTAGPLILGRWGFQMRVFYPTAGKTPWAPQPIVAFRGTEGVQFDPRGDGAAAAARKKGQSVPEQAQARRAAIEGSVDTLIGDASPAPIGWLQVQPNTDLIEANLTRLGAPAISTGHSLGGAIAQIVTALHPASFRQVVTFQSPGIEQSLVDGLRTTNNRRPPEERLQARHYRANGDVVPNAGERNIDGQIYTFDRVSRPQGTRQPFSSNVIENARSGHVAPLLSTYVRGQRTLSPDLQFLVQNGMRDEATLDKDGPREVQTVFAGAYASTQDPKANVERARMQAGKAISAYPGLDLLETAFYVNIAYNTLLSHIETLAADKSIKTLTAFKTRAAAVINSDEHLQLDKDDRELARILQMDMSVIDMDNPVTINRSGVKTNTQPTIVGRYFEQGVKIPPDVKTQITAQLDIIWKSWRGE